MISINDLLKHVPHIDASIEANKTVTHFSIDSRQLETGWVFIGMHGEHVDGNSFLNHAFEKGANLVISDNPQAYKNAYGNKILVENSLEALKAIGHYKLSLFKGKKIAVTGSYGKTTTKETIVKGLSHKPISYSSGNHNNHIGVPLSASNMDLNSEYVIFELGTNNPGEIVELSKYIKPNIAVVTSIGTAHINNFGSKDAIAKEKLAITQGLAKDGVLICSSKIKDYVQKHVKSKKIEIKYFGIYEDDDCRILEIKRDSEDWAIDYTIRLKEDGDTITGRIEHIYGHLVQNVACATLVGVSLGESAELVAKNASTHLPGKGRGTIIKTGKLNIIDETYNSSLESLTSVLHAFNQASSTQPKYALIGEIAEIDSNKDEIYKAIYSLTTQMTDISFIFYGNGYEHFDGDNITYVTTIERLYLTLDKITEGTILIKASRAYLFERYVNYLISKFR